MRNPLALALFGAVTSTAMGPVAERIIVWLFKLRRNRE